MEYIAGEVILCYDKIKQGLDQEHVPVNRRKFDNARQYISLN